MGGICGFIGSRSFKSAVGAETNRGQHVDVYLTAPMQKLRHRGPDGHGYSTNNHSYFGHTRLAIHDAPNGRQPIYNENGSLFVMLDGEIYNYRELRKRLQNRHKFRTATDTEVVLHLYEEEGLAGLGKLDGMFAIVIGGNDTAVLMRDPLGIKPLYYQKIKDGSGISYASEIKALDRKNGMIAEFPPGTVYTPEHGFRSYYKLPQEYDPDLTWDEALVQIREILTRAIEKRLTKEVPLGCFLSGGLDSSLISAIAAQLVPELPTFSVSMKGSSDRGFALMAAKHLGTRHHELIMNPRAMWQIVPKVVYYLESYDQYLVRSAVANYFLAEMAADYVKVVLIGEGADELFAGYKYLARFADWNDLHRELRVITTELRQSGLQRVDRMTMAHGLQARAPFLDVAMLELAMRIPPWFKRKNINCQGTADSGNATEAVGITKWCLREAFAGSDLLPEAIIQRGKEKFSEGTGAADILAEYAERYVSDKNYADAIAKGVQVRSKEEFYYYQIYKSEFGQDSACNLVSRSRS
jgi:asparagine synthase (glutamine-hydrolysing)